MMNQIEIEETFQALGSVSVRRLFGGKGVYHQGLIIAIEFGDQLFLKADAISAAEFEAAGAGRWTFESKTGRAVLTSYRSIPEDAFDDPEIMAHWVRLAYEAALRSSQR